jgi:predicted permease
MISDLLIRFRSLFRRKAVEAELDDELRAHLEHETEKHVRAGLSLAEAQRRARLDLGGLEQVKEECRDARGVSFIETTLQDLRYSLRMLRRSPGFASTAILILALGICSSAAIFAFVDAALIKPLPYQNPSRLVGVYESVGLFPRSNLSYLDYLDWKRMNKVFSSLEVWNGTGFLLKAPSGTEPAPGVRVSAGFFRTLGVAPVLGRDFEPSEDSPGAPATVILSHAAWEKWFGGKRDAVGQAVTLSGVSYTIIGVLPWQFQFAPRGGADFWTTLHPLNGCEKRRSCHNLYGVARLKDGVSLQSADASMKVIARELEDQYPDSNRGQGAAVVALSEAIVGPIRPILLMLLGGAGLLLLIACVNVTSLLLARSESRRHEIAVRGALGASSARLFRQFAAEGLMLAAFGGVLGTAAAGWAMPLLTRLIPANMLEGMPFLQGLGVNLRVAAFAGLVALFAAVLFAFTPAFRLRRSKLRAGLAEVGRASAGTLWRRFGSKLVVVELAVAMVLLVGAALLGQSLYHLLHVDLGFQPDHLATLQIVAPPASYEKDEQVVRLVRQIVDRLASLPGVESAAISNRLAVTGNGFTDWIRFVGRPYNGEHNEVNMRDVSPGYFSTLRAKLLHGRFFTDADDASSPHVVIINRALARKYFPGEDPIGKQFGDTTLSPKSIRTIVGVVDDIREGSLDDTEVWPTEYLPASQSPDTFFSVVVRTSQPAESLLPTLDAAIHRIDPGLGTIGEATMNQRIHDSPAAYLHRSSAWLVGGFAVLALLLGVVGLYGVVAYTVSQRTREIGVRMALGAQPESICRLVLREAARLVGTGIAAGLLGSLAASRLMRGLLFGISAWDVPSLASVAALLALSALAASYIPARRAAKVDPMVALRYE